MAKLTDRSTALIPYKIERNRSHFRERDGACAPRHRRYFTSAIFNNRKQMGLIMTTQAKLLLSAFGLVALAATPAMAKTHHVHHSHVVRVAPAQPDWYGAYGATAPAYNSDLLRYDGFQPDRQLVGRG